VRNSRFKESPLRIAQNAKQTHTKRGNFMLIPSRGYIVNHGRQVIARDAPSFTVVVSEFGSQTATSRIFLCEQCSRYFPHILRLSRPDSRRRWLASATRKRWGSGKRSGRRMSRREAGERALPPLLPLLVCRCTYLPQGFRGLSLMRRSLSRE
jgi:hypothetical protein